MYLAGGGESQQRRREGAQPRRQPCGYHGLRSRKGRNAVAG